MCVALPGRVDWIGPRTGASIPGRVTVAGSEIAVDLMMVPQVTVGDHVIVHSGFAINVVSEAAAAETLALLGELSEGPSAS